MVNIKHTLVCTALAACPVFANAEQVVNITWGEDVQPVVDGTYAIANKHNRQLLTVSGGNAATASYTRGNTLQQWDVNPVNPRIGGDFSYCQILSVGNLQTLDVLDWSLEEGASIIMYSNSLSANQQWYLEYAGDGWFRIRNRHSSLCLQADDGTVTQQAVADNEGQLWRFLPLDVRPRWQEVDAPTGLQAEARASSVRLTWDATEERNATFSLLRATEAEDGIYGQQDRRRTDLLLQTQTHRPMPEHLACLARSHRNPHGNGRPGGTV